MKNAFNKFELKLYRYLVVFLQFKTIFQASNAALGRHRKRVPVGLSVKRTTKEIFKIEMFRITDELT